MMTWSDYNKAKQEGMAPPNKTVKLVAHVEFTQSVPGDWTEEDILFRYNESTWCAGNLKEIAFENDCGCDVTHVTIKAEDTESDTFDA